MPGSFVVFDSLTRQLAEWIEPQTALDIGPGSGKYGRMLRQVMPSCRTTAVEPEASYVERFALREVYDEVHVSTGAQWNADNPDQAFDLAILGDCIEHMPKSVGLDLLNHLAYRTAYTVIVSPEFVIQGAVDGVQGEAHVSAWSERDLHWHDLWAFDNCRAVTIMVLRGYRQSTISLTELAKRVNATSIPVHEFHDPASMVRPARLRLVESLREVSYRPA